MDEHVMTVTATGGPAPVRPPESKTRAQGPKPGGHRLSWFAAAVVVVGGTAGAYYFYEREHRAAPASGHDAAAGQGEGHDRKKSGIPVQVAQPRPGGIERTTNQAGSVHAFEHAQLFAKVSGYLKVQNVDIGDRVKVGQLLAVIEDPEVDKAVEQAQAALDQSLARVKVAEAKVRTAQADKEAADALGKQSEAEVSAKISNHELQEKQLARIRGLVQRDAVEAKLQDEQQDRLDVSNSDLGVARAAVLTSRAQAMAKAAMIESARADVAEAHSNVEIARANLAKAKVMQEYTRITSPYDGVVTVRSFHRGDFVRAANEGGSVPVLAVAVTDRMRVVLPIPDVDVPFLDQGDPATLQIVALPGRTFRGLVSRFSYSEDPQSRNMRTEVDLPNPDGQLREGMYGRITVQLQPPAKGSVTIPSSGLTRQDGQSEGSVFVVRDGKARKAAVHVGNDNGVEAEILSGLGADDRVVVRYNGTIEDGTLVVPETTHMAQAEH